VGLDVEEEDMVDECAGFMFQRIPC